MSKLNKYLVSIGSEGLECVFEVTDVVEDTIVAQLRGETYTPGDLLIETLNSMSMRFRMNSHRNIETYIIEVPTELSKFRHMLTECEKTRQLVIETGTPFAMI